MPLTAAHDHGKKKPGNQSAFAANKKWAFAHSFRSPDTGAPKLVLCKEYACCGETSIRATDQVQG
jgi:hypothetical protein